MHASLEKKNETSEPLLFWTNYTNSWTASTVAHSHTKMKAGPPSALLARAIGAPENETHWKVADACFRYQK